jgi:GAF domain-containing protein
MLFRRPTAPPPTPDAPAVVGHTHDELRVARLRSYHILDTPPEAEFEEYTRFVMRACRVPVAVISLVDQDRQWFKSHPGSATKETARCISFCTHTIQLDSGRLLIIPDTLADPRFANNPLVTGPERIRFYAGAPLVTPDRLALGALCAIDHVPRDFTAEQQDALRALARMLMLALESRRRHHAYLQVCDELHATQAELDALKAESPDSTRDRYTLD